MSIKKWLFPLENLNMEPKQIEKKILELASLFDISKLLDKKTSDLTNSEKQELLLVFLYFMNQKF